MESADQASFDFKLRQEKWYTVKEVEVSREEVPLTKGTINNKLQ